MSITTYAQLQTAIETWLKRGTAHTALVTDFIALAEAVMSRELDAFQQISRSTLTCSITTPWVTLPTDAQHIDSITLTNSSSENVVLQPMGIAELDSRYYWTETGTPVAYAQNGTEIKLGPAPSAAFSMSVNYRKRFPALSVSNTSNWILSLYPDIYLFGSLSQAGDYVESPDQLTKWELKYQRGVASANRAHKNSGFGGVLQRRAG